MHLAILDTDMFLRLKKNNDKELFVFELKSIFADQLLFNT